ncbi:hypothetical protein [Saccharicrinis aurantiacus]|uniref:hypothetical protein n=1 Tax=Saccharicrinis aurantiacus TaxID=1849719 RepID=UPI0024937C12|nr:hypothetical protein [Saccharicrinis aurantiacus]
MRFINYLGQLFFFPHLLLYLPAVKKNINSPNLNANSSKHLNNKISKFNELIYKLLVDRYFRTFFYFHLNNISSKILRIFYPSYPSFIIGDFSNIKGGVKLAHPNATIINTETIGSSLYINHLVTIGEKNGKKPVIGNNVEIHANASVIGGITIGDNVIIGAGAVVVWDVPDNAVVAGNPAKIIKIRN